MLKGFQQLDRNLKKLEEEFKGDVLAKALLNAVQPVVRQAASNAPFGTGALSRSMTAKIMDYAKPGEAIVRVGPGRPEGSHGILLEYGTVHMTARPFLASAVEATHQDVIDIFGNQFDEVINGL